MVVVVYGFEVHQQGWVAVEAEGGSGEEGSFEAVTLALAQGSLGGPGGVGVLVGEGVEEPLDFYWGVEGAEGAEIPG